jgi:hypothetical protein
MPPSPNDQATPVVTTSSRSSNGTYSNTYEGGFSKFEEVTLRILQGLMPICFNGTKWMDTRAAVGMAIRYTEEFVKQTRNWQIEMDLKNSSNPSSSETPTPQTPPQTAPKAP